MKKEVYELIQSARRGDKTAMEKLVRENTGLIWSIVRRFGGRTAETEDLFQIGAIGLIKAINKFDLSLGVELSTYAVPMIIGEMRRFLRDDGIIKVSRGLKETAMHAKRAAEKISAQIGRDATAREIAQEIGKPVDEVTLALEAVRRPDSLHRPLGDEASSPALLADRLCRTENGEEKIVSGIALREELKKLPPRERQILLLRFYKEKTQSEVARIMGLSQVQISRIERKTLSCLRKNIG